jgi:hypothetical protein
VPSDRTTVTEIGTGLGMLGLPDVESAVRSRTPVMRSLSPEMWDHLERLRAGAAYDAEFHAAWANGQAFLGAKDGLRGRQPEVVEWKGTGRAPGDEVAPIDLRVDHVYLVSCKYLSDILFNVAPAGVFDSLLASGSRSAGRDAHDGLPGGRDWYAEVAPAEYQALYECVRCAAIAAPEAGSGAALAPRPKPVRGGTIRGAVSLPGMDARVEVPGGAEAGDAAADAPRTAGTPAAAPLSVRRDLPGRAVELSSAQRDALALWLRAGWPAGAKERYTALSDAVARASTRRWEVALGTGGDRPARRSAGAAGAAGEAMLWRLLRIGSAPYFVLGSSSTRSLRLRIATSWDWRQQYRLLSFAVEPQPGGQPRVGWEATVRDRTSDELHAVEGHIEVRWSHGRFGGPPEAKGYLDTSHHRVPGYYALR